VDHQGAALRGLGATPQGEATAGGPVLDSGFKVGEGWEVGKPLAVAVDGHAAEAEGPSYLSVGVKYL